MVIAEEDVLDAGGDKAADDLQHRRPSAREGDLRCVAVKRKLALAALGGDDGEVPRRRIHVVKQGHAIAQVAVGRTVPRHRYQNVRVGRLGSCPTRRTSLAAGKDGNAAIDITEDGWRHHRQRNRVHRPAPLGDANAGRFFVIATKRVYFKLDRAAVDR